MKVPRLNIPPAVIDRTLGFLREAGQRESEGIVLWLGQRGPDDIDVTEAFVPIHTAASHRFRIPPAGMRELMQRLGETSTFVAAQVHSHPEEPFHSWADDAMAIISHAGACSLVLPYFAADTTPANFVDQTALFCLSDKDEWVEVTEPNRSRILRLL